MKYMFVLSTPHLLEIAQQCRGISVTASVLIVKYHLAHAETAH
jgi:hypothetical protein